MVRQQYIKGRPTAYAVRYRYYLPANRSFWAEQTYDAMFGALITSIFLSLHHSSDSGHVFADKRTLSFHRRQKVAVVTARHRSTQSLTRCPAIASVSPGIRAMRPSGLRHFIQSRLSLWAKRAHAGLLIMGLKLRDLYVQFTYGTVRTLNF